MTLQMKPSLSIKNKEEHESHFTPDQLEILKEEYSKKLVNEEMKNLENLDAVNNYRKKYCVSKRDALDILARD